MGFPHPAKIDDTPGWPSMLVKLSDGNWVTTDEVVAVTMYPMDSPRPSTVMVVYRRLGSVTLECDDDECAEALRDEIAAIVNASRTA